jgi:hypothetical protein
VIDGPAQAEGRESFLSWMRRASGPIGIVIMVMSFYMIALIAWMATQYRRAVAVPAGLVRDVGELLNQKQFTEAYQRLAADTSFLARVLAAGVRKLPSGPAAAQRAMEMANDDVTMDMSTGVVIGNTLFGFSARNSGQYFALDANTGRTLWLSEARIAENAAVVRAGDLWLALNTEAKLLVARANPKQLDILKTYDVADSATWAQPVLSGQRIFIKDLSTVSLWTLN